jgi:DNA-binding NarL/FixJ family response regulator
MRLAIADDAVLFRQGLAQLLTSSGFEVTAQVSDATTLLAQIETDPPDAVILDIRMPPTFTNEGLLAAAEVRTRFPATAVLLLSQYVETDHALQLLEGEGGRVGYLLKERVTDITELSDALDRLARGSSVIDPEVVTVLLRRRRTADTLMELTDREREVLALMAEGRSNRAIEQALFLGQKTIETHISNIFAKLGLEKGLDDHRRVLAVLTYLRS